MSDRRQQPVGWQEANRSYLEYSLKKLRVLLRHRIATLRVQWRKDPLSDYRELVVSDEQADELLADEVPQTSETYAELAQTLDQLDQALEECAESAMQAGAVPALEMLAQLFDLTPFERSVLVLCVATECDSGFERLYAYVQNDVQRKYATAHLALSIYEDELDAGHEAFQPTAPLRRFRLVTLGPAPQHGVSRASWPLHLDERIAGYIRGANRLDQHVETVLGPVPSAPLSENQKELATRVANALSSASTPIRVQLLGRTRTELAPVALAIAGNLGLGLAKLDTERVPAPETERQELIGLLTREATLLQLAIYVETDEPIVARAFARDFYAPLIVATDAYVDTEPPLLAVQVGPLTAAEQRDVWLEAMGPGGIDLHGEIERLVQQFDFGARQIAEAVASAQSLARLRPAKEERLTPSDLWQACRQRSGLDLADLARRIEPCYDWGDLVLPESSQTQLAEIAAQVSDRAAVYEEWGFGKKLSRGRGINALFSGRSGTGKTMAAEVLASRLDLDLYRIDLASVVSKYIGETEKNLKRIFDAAERSGAILFFDEADALFGKRSEVSSSHDRYANIEINYLLQRMEDYRGLAILASNRKADLDGAFLRRLRFVVEFPFPDSASRQRIWENVFPAEAPTEGLDFQALASLEIAGGTIRNIAVNGAFLAKSEGTPIRMAHLHESAKREYVKLEKLMGIKQLERQGGGSKR